MKESEIWKKIVMRLFEAAHGEDDIELIRFAIDHYDAALWHEGYVKEQEEERLKKEGGSADGI